MVRIHVRPPQKRMRIKDMEVTHQICDHCGSKNLVRNIEVHMWTEGDLRVETLIDIDLCSVCRKELQNDIVATKPTEIYE